MPEAYRSRVFGRLARTAGYALALLVPFSLASCGEAEQQKHPSVGVRTEAEPYRENWTRVDLDTPILYSFLIDKNLATYHSVEKNIRVYPIRRNDMVVGYMVEPLEEGAEHSGMLREIERVLTADRPLTEEDIGELAASSSSIKITDTP